MVATGVLDAKILCFCRASVSKIKEIQDADAVRGFYGYVPPFHRESGRRRKRCDKAEICKSGADEVPSQPRVDAVDRNTGNCGNCKRSGDGTTKDEEAVSWFHADNGEIGCQEVGAIERVVAQAMRNDDGNGLCVYYAVG